MADNLSPVQELAALREQTASNSAELTRINGELTAANGLLAEAQTQISALAGERDSARADVTRITGELAAANANLSAVTGERDNFKTAVETGGFFSLSTTDGKPALAMTPAGKTHFINAEVTRVVASAGAAPLPIAVDNPPGALAPNANAGLNPRQRLAASIKVQG